MFFSQNMASCFFSISEDGGASRITKAVSELFFQRKYSVMRGQNNMSIGPSPLI
jgi:hypothetical protein